MGRNSLMMVIGFNVIMMLMGFHLSQYSSDAYMKYSNYYAVEQAQYAAQSATNIALSGLFVTNMLNPGARWIAPSGTVTFDKAYANGNGSFTIVVDSTFSVKKDTIQVRVAAKYGGVNATTVVDFARASFTTFAMFNVNENGIYWITGDTCRGPLHTQDYLYVSGNPYFKGAVTTGKGIKKLNSSDAPTFAGGYHSPVNQPMPADLGDVKGLGRATGGKDLVRPNPVSSYPVPGYAEVLFKDDGKIYITVTPQTGVSHGNPTYGTPVTTMYPSSTALAANSVLLVENMPVRLKGVLNGKLTVGSVGTGSCVFIDSSIAYSVNPKLPNGDPNPACTSTLGIVADNDVMITDNTKNSNNVTIDASIFSLTGGFGAENYDTRSVCGDLNLVGAIQAKDRNPVGTFSGGTLQHGFHKDYDYDSRLGDTPPAGYPQTTNFQVKNWYENTVFDQGLLDNLFGFLGKR
jgi:hypothetical protein